MTTTIALLLQEQPPSPVGFPSNRAGIADGRYTDTEDASASYSAEAPPTEDGFGSENSVTRDPVGTL